ncbi:pitrilysin family protein [Williamsia sp.]|uniref:M16 family metallopeptidase n=1 Tax=Williamsia sp. TaxID=1872085 RepID=UPI001A34D0F7|nr:pitrilysin family protein [Williamsia sp.]MBJ7291375.1 insulinase family protein [Williamsia sp.]
MSKNSVRTQPTGTPDAVRRSVLPGGLRVVTEQVPGVRSVSVGLWVGVGSRDEKPSVAGAAHFLEHLLFKATPTRTAASIAQDMDAVGGELNAFTSKEHTCFYAHVLDEHADMAIDMLADVVLRGRCATSDVDTERDVVLEEIAMRDDDHEDLLADAFMTAMFGDHPIGRPVIGSAESITAMSRRQIHSFHTRRYTPDTMVLAVAGNITHAAVLAQVRASFGAHLRQGTPAAGVRASGTAPRSRAGLEFIHRDTEQTHLLFGMPSPGVGHPDRFALSVLNAAIGGGLSSRLFQQIREERGLAYSVYSSVDSFSDVGTFSVYAGCSPDRVADVADVAMGILGDVAENGISDAECARAQGALRGSLLLGLEDTQSRMHRLGSAELDFGRRRPVSRSLSQIEAVRPAQVRAVARRVLGQRPAVAVVGPYRRARDLPRSVRGLTGV